MIGNVRLRSWGFCPPTQQTSIVPLWRPAECPCSLGGESLLAFGNGRSYGDSCINSVGTLIDTKALNKIIEFDSHKGVLRAEPGLRLHDILNVIVPKGWFLPVTPGTSQITLGGAIANDVHGKNHHGDGTFGRYVTRFRLLRSNGEVCECNGTQNTELFAATIGGLGLTGLISDISLKLMPIASSYMNVRYDTFTGIQEFLELSAERKHTHQYTVAWLDCISSGSSFARGVFLSANHADKSCEDIEIKSETKRHTFPINLPSRLLNRYSIGVFNALYYRLHKRLNGSERREHYSKYFYPLDSVGCWNRIYGSNGFHQSQFVLPIEEIGTMERILRVIVESGMGSFLAVLKEFGSVSSPGLLSFPRPGLCLALDFADRGGATRELIAQINRQVINAGGAVYPAKDRLMTAHTFQESFPQLDDFKKMVDPNFNSDFWSRVNE